MSWTDPTTGGALDWANGLVVASTDIDLIRDNFLHIGNATGLDWIDWTPTVVQGGAVTVTVDAARYVKLRTTAIAMARLVVTGAGTSGNAIKIQGIPAAITPAVSTAIAHVVGSAIVHDASAAFFQGAAYFPQSFTTCIQIIHDGQAFPVGNSTPAISLAAGDCISFAGVWPST